MKKTNLGPVAVKIDRESVNALLQSLNQIAAIDPENHIAQSAQKLMQKIIKHGRTFPHDGSGARYAVQRADRRSDLFKLDPQAVDLYLKVVPADENDKSVEMTKFCIGINVSQADLSSLSPGDYVLRPVVVEGTPCAGLVALVVILPLAEHLSIGVPPCPVANVYAVVIQRA